MTLAIGVSCPAGAALVADSMTMRSTADGNVEGFLSAEHKLGQTRDLACVLTPEGRPIHETGLTVTLPPNAAEKLQEAIDAAWSAVCAHEGLG